MSMTCREIVELVGGELAGDGAVIITGLEELALAGEGDLTFIGDEAHAKQWAGCAASAVLLKRGVEIEGGGRAVITVGDVDLAMAKVLERYAEPVTVVEGVDASARIDGSAEIGDGVGIGPNCVVGPGVVVGAGAQLHANVVLMRDVRIGAGCVLWPGVVVRDRCVVGDGSVLHAGVVLGADGFGYRPSPDGKGIVKIPQIGHVEVGRDVEIGANTCVDCGKFSATVIGDGSKIDNLVQIGHNVRVGRCVVIAGKTGVAGSTIIEDGVTIGGGCNIRDHVRIARGATLAGGSQLMNDIPAGETWAGSPAQNHRVALKEHVAIRNLPEVMKKVRKYMKDMD